MTQSEPRGYWLLKTEPDVFSFDDLVSSPEQTAIWEGVRNYQARNFLREMRVGDAVLIYHSNCKPPGVVGVAEVARDAYPDPTQFDTTSDYYDEKSGKESPRWAVVDIRAVRVLEDFVSLKEIKSTPELADMKLVQRGNRLSVMPVTASEFKVILALGDADG